MQLVEMQQYIKQALAVAIERSTLSKKIYPLNITIVPPKFNKLLANIGHDESLFHSDPGTCWFFITSKSYMKEKKEKLDHFLGGESQEYVLEALSVIIPIALGLAGVSGTELAMEGLSAGVHIGSGFKGPSEGMSRAVQKEAWKSAKKTYKKTGDQTTVNSLAVEHYFIAGGPAAFQVKEDTKELVLSFRPTTDREVFRIWRTEALTTDDEARVDGEGARKEAIVKHKARVESRPDSLAVRFDGSEGKWGHYPETHQGLVMTRYMARTADAAGGRLWNPVHFIWERGGTLARSTTNPFPNQATPSETRTDRQVLGPESWSDPTKRRQAMSERPEGVLSDSQRRQGMSERTK